MAKGWKPPEIGNEADGLTGSLSAITETLGNISEWGDELISSGFQTQVKAGLVTQAGASPEAADAVARDFVELLRDMCNWAGESSVASAILQHKVEDLYIQPIKEQRAKARPATAGLKIN